MSKSLLRVIFALICAPVVIIATVAAGPSQGMQSGGCNSCHAGGSGHEVAPQLNPDDLTRGAHSTLSCTDCHEGVSLAHAPDLPSVDCGSCHEENAKGFLRGVHWQPLQALNPGLSPCTACHGYHGIEPVDSLTSPVSHLKVYETCGSCHENELKLFIRSSHGDALKDEAKQGFAPTCVTCHGEHAIFEATAPASPAAPGRQPKTCGACHDNPEMAAALGIAPDRMKTYGGTIHGLRNRFGVTTAATCSDCHSNHLILPQSHQESTVSMASLVRTCGRCHQNANENFIKTKIHTEATPENNLGVFIARWFYIIFIGVLAIGFITHITFDLIEMRRRRREGKHGRA